MLWSLARQVSGQESQKKVSIATKSLTFLEVLLKQLKQEMGAALVDVERSQVAKRTATVI